MKASAFDRFRGEEVFPDSRVQTEAQIVEYLRQTVESIYHPVGTCKMGNDGMAVVDAKLRVHRTQGLRVVAASIMPTIVGGVELQPNIRSNVGKVTQFDQISKNQYRLVPDSASPVLV
ncbi:MAG: GMC oxidoreductase [Geitlerinemataceae cyanobacterium]